QLGRVAEGPEAAGSAATAAVSPRRAPEPTEASSPAAGPSVRRVVLGTTLFGAVYYLACEAGAPAAAIDALLLLPPAAAAAVLWRTVDQPAWRRTYGAIAAFALGYGTLGVFANGLAGRMPAPGAWSDIAWFVPFAFLLCAAGPAAKGEVSALPALLAAGAGS